MTQSSDYVIDTGHGQVAEGVYELAVSVETSEIVEESETGEAYMSLRWFGSTLVPTGQLIAGAGL